MNYITNSNIQYLYIVEILSFAVSIRVYGKKKAKGPKVPWIEVDSALRTGLLPKRPSNSVNLKSDAFFVQKCFC